MNEKKEILDKLNGGLIVSCQALADEPLHSSFIMSRMALAAKQGGAAGIRANSPEDIRAIREAVDLPVIGLLKRDYPDSPIYITSTRREVEELMEARPEIIAVDATNRVRPGGISLAEFFTEIRRSYPGQLFLADCATYEDGIRAQELGFDLVSTTLCGYTEDTRDVPLPNHNLVERLAGELQIPVIAEGGIWEPQDFRRMLEARAFAVVIGTAITRPREITRRFVQAMDAR